MAREPMADLILTQAEADELVALEKRQMDGGPWWYPQPGSGLNIPLCSMDGREEFSLDLYHGRIALTKQSVQNRTRRTVILVRLCVQGSVHRNPDDEAVPATHLHLFREGFADKWACPVPDHAFRDTNNLMQTVKDFMCYCQVVDPPLIQYPLGPL